MKVREKIKKWFDAVDSLPSRISRDDTKAVKKSPKTEKSRKVPIGTQGQLDAYKERKRILFKRMRYGAVLMCCLIIFLSWSQWYFPKRNRKFWNTGPGA